MKKGSKLYIEGKIQTRSWDDKETGAKRYRTEIIVNELSLLSGREEGAGSAGKFRQRGGQLRPAPARRHGRRRPIRRNLRRRYSLLGLYPRRFPS